MSKELFGLDTDQAPLNLHLGEAAYKNDRELQVSRALKVTTTERDALAVSNGDFVYNTTTLQFEFYQNGAWVFYTATPA